MTHVISGRDARRTAEAVADQGRWFGVPKWAVGSVLVVVGGLLIGRSVLGSDAAAPPLDLFTRVGAADVVEVRKAVDADATVVRLRDPDGNTPLHVAATIGSAAEVRLLLDRGADANAVNAAGRSPLVSALAAPHDKAAIVEALVAAGASASTPLPKGRSVKQIAQAIPGIDPAVLALLNAGPASKPR